MPVLWYPAPHFALSQSTHFVPPPEDMDVAYWSVPQDLFAHVHWGPDTTKQAKPNCQHIQNIFVNV